VLGVHLEDHLADRDGLGEEAVAGVALGDALIDRERALLLVRLDQRVAELDLRLQVLGVGPGELFVELGGLGELALAEGLAGVVLELAEIGHGHFPAAGLALRACSAARRTSR
jgi:hypothetical protein